MSGEVGSIFMRHTENRGPDCQPGNQVAHFFLFKNFVKIGLNRLFAECRQNFHRLAGKIELPDQRIAQHAAEYENRFFRLAGKIKFSVTDTDNML